MSRRAAAGIAVLCLLALVVATTGGSGPGPGTGGYDDIGERITAEPHDGPNGAYAHLDDEGKLAVDLTAGNDAVEGDGVPAEAITGVDDVFTLNYTGDDYAHVWLEHESDDVTFYRSDGDGTGSNPSSIEGMENNATLEPYESIDVGFTVDSHGKEATDVLIREITIHGKVPDEDEDDESDSDAESDTTVACPTGPSVTVEASDKTTRAISIADADGCGLESIDLHGLTLGDGVSLARLDVTLAGDEASFAVAAEKRFDGARFERLRTKYGVEPIGAVALENASGDGDALENVSYRLVVDRSRLDRTGTGGTGVTVWRYDGKTWTDGEIEQVAGTESTLEYVIPADPTAEYVVALEGEKPDSDETAPGDDPEDRDADEDGTDESKADREESGPADGMPFLALGIVGLGFIAALLGVRFVRTRT
ncbi:Protein of unknown function [Halobiforma haloterrestris]|uniref:PGF-pre-PGF domain-containing protein n=1 Tax=Natronobacterium haloterrestre TaxID=148448 RepID=A0A1I1DW52_NATHA|nr:DUF1102 domain-containing protein [Halobiforma haloterrestris]SFB79057.1 Protein of unknown function [Halobiforma haloterrestris]